MVQPQIRMLSSHISHMALHCVWRDSVATQRHGFDLVVDICGVEMDGRPANPMSARAPVIHNATMCANRVCEILERSLAPVIGLEGPDEIEHLQESWAELLSPKPYPPPLAVWNVYDLDVAHDPRVNFIGPFETWDTSLLRSIADAGHIDALYGGAQQAANPEVNIAI